MSVLAFAGGELGSTAELFNPSGISMETSIVHGGRYSYRVSNGGFAYLTFPASTIAYFRGYFYLPTGHTQYSQLISVTDVSLAGFASIFAYAPGTSGAVLQLNSATQAWLGTTPVIEGFWHRLEFAFFSGGYFEVRLNGRQEIVRNDFGTVSPAGSVAILASTPGAGNVLWDDLHVTEDGFPGPGYVIARQGEFGVVSYHASIAPAYDQFTKNGSLATSDYCWSDTPANAGTNATATAVNQTQTMRLEACSSAPMGAVHGRQCIAMRDTIYGAKIYAHGHRILSNADHYIVRSDAGVLTRSGPFNFTTLDTVQATEIFPATLTQLDAMEIGAARGATTQSTLVINDMWLMVSYAAAPDPMRHFTGFETGSINEIGGFVGAVTIDATRARSGVYSAKCVGPNAYFVLNLTPLDADNVWVRGYVYMAALPSTPTTVLILQENWFVPEVALYVLSNGRAQLNAGAVTTTTPTPVFVAGAWNYVEVFKRASVWGNGVAKAWVNDQELSLPIVETGGATVIVYCGIRSITTTFWFDDLALSETGRIGPGRVLARQGRAGTPTDNIWTLSAPGPIYVNWSNTPVNTLTWAAASNVNTAQTMLVNPQANGGVVLSPMDTILACRIVAWVRYSGTPLVGGPTALRVRIPRSGQPALVKDTAVSIVSMTTALAYSDVFATVLEQLNSIEIGARHGGSSAGHGMVVDDLWLMVAYADLEILDLPMPSIPAPVAIVEIEL